MAIDVTRGATAGAAQYPILELNKAKECSTISQSAAFNLELTGGDYKTVILMSTATANTTVTFAIGNGIQGVGSSVVVTLAKASTQYAICLDSGYFKNVSGAAKDCVTITPSAAVSFTVVELPQ